MVQQSTSRSPHAVRVGRFEDIGISGYKDVERPDFDKLCALVASGGVDVVIVCVHQKGHLTKRGHPLNAPSHGL